MSPASDPGARRRERLGAIADQHTETIHAESSFSANGNLIVADTSEELADLIAKEVAEGWPTHGRVWDLDAEWDAWGNLRAVHRVVLAPGPEMADDPGPGSTGRPAPQPEGPRREEP